MYVFDHLYTPAAPCGPVGDEKCLGLAENVHPSNMSSQKLVIKIVNVLVFLMGCFQGADVSRIA